MSGTKGKFKIDLILSTKQTAKLFALQCKSILKSPTLIFMIFFFPLVLAAGLGTLIPTRSLFSSSYSLIVLLIVGIVYGNIRYSMNESTLKSNSRLAVINEGQTILSIVMTTFLFTAISFNIQLLFMVICESNNFLFMNGFVFQGETSNSSQDIIWNNVSWVGVYGYFLVTYMLMLSTFYFADNFFASYRTFSMFVLVWMIVNLVFGGVMSSIWTDFDSNINEFVSSNRLNQGWKDMPYEDAIDWDKGSFAMNNWFDISAIFVPQWYSNQHFFYVFGAGAVHTDSSFVIPANGISNAVPANYNFFAWSKTDNLWNFSLIAPYIYSILFVSFSLMIKGE